MAFIIEFYNNSIILNIFFMHSHIYFKNHIVIKENVLVKINKGIKENVLVVTKSEVFI